MRRPILALLLALLASAPADAQIGRRLIDRARDTVRETVRDATPNAPTPAQAEAAATGAATSAAGAAVPSGPLAPGPSGYLPGVNWYMMLQTQLPARMNGIAYPSYVNVVFFDPARTYTVAFEDANGLVIREAGTVAGAVGPDGVHGQLSPRPTPNDLPPSETGTYAFVVRADGHVIGRLPFTVERVASGDPLHPTPQIFVEGPWRTAGALQVPDTGRRQPRFYYWVRRDEMGADGRFTVVLYRGGTRVGAERSHSLAVGMEWLPGENEFFGPDGRTILEMSDLADGAYRIAIESDGRTVKAYPFQIAGGQVVPHPRSALGHEPRETWLAPTRSSTQPLIWLDAE